MSAIKARTIAAGSAADDRALSTGVGVVCSLLLIVCAAAVIELTTPPATLYAPTVVDSPPSITHPVMIETLSPSIPTPER